MKTDIEKILNDNKTHLDLEMPPSDAWENIRLGLKQKPVKSSLLIWKAAAAVFLVTSIGLLVYNSSLQNRVDELASLGDISEEYQEVENAYLSEINQLTSEISIKEVMKARDLAWMAEELRALEEVNKQYRLDIGSGADEQLLAGALIDYYEKKIRLLKKLELEINRQKNEKRTTDYTRTI